MYVFFFFLFLYSHMTYGIHICFNILLLVNKLIIMVVERFLVYIRLS